METGGESGSDLGVDLVRVHVGGRLGSDLVSGDDSKMRELGWG